MKEKSSQKKAMPAQPPAKKKPVARRITKTARKPAPVKGGWTAGASEGAAVKKPDPFACTNALAKVNSWPGLFDLYCVDGKYWAALSRELGRIYTATRRGHAKDDKTIIRLEQALELLGMAYNADQGIADDGWSSAAWKLLGDSILTDLTATLGRSLWRLHAAKSEREASKEADKLSAFLVKATNGLWKARFPQARGSNKGSKIPRETLAIQAAKELCEAKHRLPSKLEVRQKLESDGLKYAENKDLTARWREFLNRAGLNGLPDV